MHTIHKDHGCLYVFAKENYLIFGFLSILPFVLPKGKDTSRHSLPHVILHTDEFTRYYFYSRCVYLLSVSPTGM